MYRIYASTANNRLFIGHKGENEARCVIFNLASLRSEFGNGTWEVVHQRCGDTAPYIVTNTRELDNNAIWVITSVDTDKEYEGRCELRYYTADGTLAKTDVYITVVLSSIGIYGSPSPSEDLLNKMAEIKNEAENAAANAADKAVELADEKLSEYVDAAAESASESEKSASAAATSEENASNAELNASKYAADALAAQTAAANSATAADESATEADTSKTAAAGSAETAAAAATQAAIYKDEAFSVTPEGYEAVATYATQGLIIDDDGYFYALVEGEEE